MNKKLLAAVLLVCLAVCLCFAACQPTEERPQEVVLNEIKVTTPPTKTTYVVGEKFDNTGMVVTAVYSDKTEKAVTNYTFAPTDELGVSDKEIVVTYTEKSITKSASVAITVAEATPDSIDAPIVVLGEDRISWGAVNGATAYEVYIDGTLVDTVTTTEYALDLASGSYEITVKATFVKGDKKVTSEASNTVNYIYNSQLGAPLLAVNDNVVTWQAVEKADKYVVYVNDEEKQTITETSYTVAETDIGVYKIAVVAKDSTGERTDSDKSNVVSYIVKVDLTKAITVVNNGKVLSLNASRSFAEAENDYTTSTDATSLLAEAVGDNYALRTFDGRYLVYVPSSSVMENRTWVFADKLQADNQNFIWKLTLSEGTANEYTISSVGAGLDNALAVVDGNVFVDMLSTPTTNAEQRKFVINQSTTSVDDFADAQYAVSEPFDITKPFVGYYESLSTETDRYLGIKNEEYIGTNSSIANYLSERTEFSPYVDTSVICNSIFQFESVSASLTVADKTYNENLYRIRTYAGKYLTAVKGNYINGGGDDFVTAIDSNIENLWQIWYVPTISEGVVRLQNLGHLYDWQSSSQDISGHALCNRNLEKGITGFYNTANLPETGIYYNLIVSNVDVPMNKVDFTDLSGKTYFITSVYDKANRVTVAQRDTMYIDAYVQEKSAEFKFTLEKATTANYGNVYYVKYANGQYLTFNSWANTGLADFTGADNQKFVFNQIAGIKDGYTIHPLLGGKYPDVAGIDNLTVYFANYPDVNKPGVEQYGLYSEVMSAYHCNWFQRMFVLETTTEETFVKETKVFDLTKPLFMGIKNAIDYNGSYLGLHDTYTGTSGKVENYLTTLNILSALEDKTSCVFQFEPIDDREGWSITVGSTTFKDNLYRIRTYNGKYLTAVSGLYVNGPATNDYIGAYELDTDNMWQVWHIASQNDNVLELQNFGAVYAWNNDQLYFVNRNYDLSQDGATGFWNYIPNNDAFKIVCTNIEVEMQPIYHKNLSGKFTIKNLGSNTNIVYDNTRQKDNVCLRTATEEDVNPDCDFTLEKVEKDGVIYYRIISSDGKYLTFNAWFSMTWEDATEPGDNTLWHFQEVCGVENGYLISAYGQYWLSNDGKTKFQVLYPDYQGLKGLPSTNYLYSEVNYANEYICYYRVWQLNVVA